MRSERPCNAAPGGERAYREVVRHGAAHGGVSRRPGHHGCQSEISDFRGTLDGGVKWCCHAPVKHSDDGTGRVGTCESYDALLLAYESPERVPYIYTAKGYTPDSPFALYKL